MMPLHDDQYISLSPTDSPAGDTGMDDGAAAPCQAVQQQCQQGNKGLTRLPAVTPRTPSPNGVDFQQFCDQLRTDLPGDSHGRRSFDTSARFVAGDPGARFGDAAPLEYEVTGEIGHPHWELIFEHILRQCGYLVEFHTVYVMVDNRDLANHKRQDSSLPHWPAAARWRHSRLKLIGLMMPGLAPVLSLPGDRMFQATEITAGHQRPAIMHAYGGAKVGMERSLSSIAAEGWIPMAAAMLGTAAKPPMWASIGLRPVAGTTIDFRVLPPFLSEREKLLLSQVLPCPNSWLELMWTMDRMDVNPLPFCSRVSVFKRQLISIKLSTYTHWKTWWRMALTPRSSAS